jgi:hypothetical protein
MAVKLFNLTSETKRPTGQLLQAKTSQPVKRISGWIDASDGGNSWQPDTRQATSSRMKSSLPSTTVASRLYLTRTRVAKIKSVGTMSVQGCVILIL